MKKQGSLSIALTGLLLAFSCSSSTTGPDAAIEDLSSAEQMALVSTELSSANGGLMSDLQMLAETNYGASAALFKTSSLDTSITQGWITYGLILSYYTQNGTEQNSFVPGVTDSVAYSSSLSGQYTDPGGALEIVLDTHSTLHASGFKSLVIRVDGTGSNNSTYTLATRQRQLHVEAASTYQAQNVVVDLNAETPFPSSGALQGTLKGTFAVEGIRASGSKAYEFTVTIEFIGDGKAAVTLPNGNTFTLNLKTGQVS